MRNQFDERGFPGTGRTDNAERLLRWHVQRDIAEHRAIFLIFKRQFAEFNFAVQHIRFQRVFFFDDVRLRIEHFLHAFHRCGALLEHADHPTERDKRPNQNAGIQHKCGELANRNLIVNHQSAAEQNNHCERQTGGQRQ